MPGAKCAYPARINAALAVSQDHADHDPAAAQPHGAQFRPTMPSSKLPCAQFARWVSAEISSGGIHTVTGATVSSVEPMATSTNSDEIRVGESFIWRFAPMAATKQSLSPFKVCPQESSRAKK